MPPLERSVVQFQGIVNSILVCELNVRIPLRVPRVAICLDGHPVDRPTRSEMSAQLLRCSTVIHLPNVHTVLIQPPSHLVQLALHSSLCRRNICELVIHLRDLALHLSRLRVLLVVTRILGTSVLEIVVVHFVVRHVSLEGVIINYNRAWP